MAAATLRDDSADSHNLTLRCRKEENEALLVESE